MRTRITRIGIGAALILVAVIGLLITRPASQPTVNSSSVAKAVQPAAPNAAANAAINVSSAPWAAAQADEILPNGVRVIHDAHHDLSPPLRDIPPAPDQPWTEGPENPLPHFLPSGPVKDTVVQNFFGPLAMPTPILTFEGISNPTGCGGCVPPDTNGDVGPNHYVQTVNLKYQIWDKNGNSLFGPVNTNTIWSGFGGPCQNLNSGDPVVNYDPMADRWVVSQFTSSAPYYQCIAVSQTPDPTNTYYRYAFLESNTDLYDYPKMGVWPDAYYMTANVFVNNGASYGNPAIVAFDRTRMLAGLAATAQFFNPGNYYFGLLPADLDGSILPPAGAREPILTLNGNNTTLRLWNLHVDFATPTNSHLDGPTLLGAAPWDPNLCGLARNCIPQPGVPTSQYLDSLGDHTMFRLAYRRFADGHEALVTNESVDADGTDHSGIRWYEIRDPNGTPYIFQQSTYAPDATNRWMGSMAMDHDGNIAIGYSASSTTVYPSIRYAGRLATDPLGQLAQGEAEMFTGTGAQTTTFDRWGDYSDLTVDPSDDCTFWYTNEYYPVNSTTNWHTRIGKFKFSTCGQPPVTPTGTPPTATPTSPPTSTPVPRPNCTNYTFTTNMGTLVAGTTDIGNHCDDCATSITLPFPVKIYERTFTSAYVTSNGVVEFNNSDYPFGNACLPVPVIDYGVAAYWDDLITSCSGCGVFTSTSGTAPNRILNVEWRAQVLNNSSNLNVEVRLYESPVSGMSRVDIQYGTSIGEAGTGSTVGIQRDLTTYTQFSCNTSSITANMLITFTAPPCEEPTAVPTNTNTPTSTNTAISTNTATRTNTPGGGTDTPTPTLTSTACPIQFSDVPNPSTFYAYIRCLACRGIVNGYSDGTFRPNNNVTRGQLSKIVSNSAGFNDPQTTQMFEDVPVGSTFFDYIGRLASRGYINGYPCGGTGEPCNPPGNLPYFRTNNNATRGQITKIVSNAAGFVDPPAGQIFEDSPPGSTFYTYTNRLASRGVMQGYPCGGAGEPCNPPNNRPYFRPFNNATRGQTSKIVANTFFPDCETPSAVKR